MLYFIIFYSIPRHYKVLRSIVVVFCFKMHFGDYVPAVLAAASSFTQRIFSDPFQPSEQSWPGKKVDYYARNLKTITTIYNLTVFPSTICSLLYFPLPLSPLLSLTIVYRQCPYHRWLRGGTSRTLRTYRYRPCFSPGKLHRLRRFHRIFLRTRTRSLAPVFRRVYLRQHHRV